MQLNVVPVLLGDGARLFEDGAGGGAGEIASQGIWLFRAGRAKPKRARRFGPSDRGRLSGGGLSPLARRHHTLRL